MMQTVNLIVSILTFVGVFYIGLRPKVDVGLILRRIKKMSAALDRLTQEVADTKAVSASVLALVEGLAQQIRDNVDDSDALNALADELDANEEALADAVEANTAVPPADPPVE